MNVDVFSEGFDCPDVEFVQLARPTLSLAKYLQQVGRGLRRSEGKEACMLIDNVGPVSYTHLDVYKRQELAFVLHFFLTDYHWECFLYHNKLRIGKCCVRCV